MADANEDLLTHPPHSLDAAADSDSDDGTPDFSAFASLLKSSKSKTANATTSSSLPRRGEKDFEPHGTTTQSSVLATSRAEMHHALSYERIHQPNKRISGVYERESGLTRVENSRGKMLQTMGWADRRGVLRLRAEEALYLVERGDLDVRWEEEGAEPGGVGLMGEGEAKAGLTFSLQTAYAVYVGDVRKGVSLERYNVYANLKRAGYAVFRGPAWEAQDEGADELRAREKVVEGGRNGAWAWLYSLLWREGMDGVLRPLHGPLRRPGPYRSYREIYRQMDLVAWHDPTLPTARESRSNDDEKDGQADESTADPIRVSFYVYKPKEAFKKSNPGPPDFRIAVLDAREQSVPSIDQIDGLLASTPYSPPQERPENDNAGKMYARLKHGYRNVILAVVDQGIISYLRISDAGFGREKLYDGAGRSKFGNKGGRRGGRGGGRGGRGRGRGG